MKLAYRLLALCLVCLLGDVCAAEKLYGITETGWFLAFDSQTPSKLTHSQQVFTSYDSLVSMDIDQTGEIAEPILFYSQDDNVRASRFNIAQLQYLGAASLSVRDEDQQLLGSHFGFEVSPTGKFRVVTNGRLNMEITPNLVSPSSSTYVALPELYYALDDINAVQTPNVTQIAYGKDGSGNEVLYGIDAALDSLVWFTAGSGGELRTIGKLRSGDETFNVGPEGGFDISARTGTAYVAAETFNGYGNRILEVNLATGEVLKHYEVAGGAKLMALAVPEPAALALAGMGLVAAPVLLGRRKG